MTGIIKNSVNFVRPNYDELPKCLIFDANSCEFSNGDEIFIEDSNVSGMPYENGYVLDLGWFDHESQEMWDGYTVFVQQGSITPVWHYSIDYEFSDNGKYECAYIDELVLDDSQPYVATKLYPDSCEQWKDLLVACMTFY